MILLWIIVLLSFLGSITNFVLLITFLKATFKSIDKIENIESIIDELDRKKINRPVPPPDIVPLEKM
jgi:hypothetical protein